MPKILTDEISIAEFAQLGETVEKAKVKEDALLDLISEKAKSTSKIARELGLSYSATFSRLNHLLEKKKVYKRGKESRAFWLKRRDITETQPVVPQPMT